MRRVRRWLLNGLAVVSAVLFVGACVLWVRSYRETDAPPFTRHGVHWSVACSQGVIGVSNAPQRELESRQYLAELSRRVEASRLVDERLVPLWQVWNKAPPRSPERRQSFERLTNYFQQSNSAAEQMWAAVQTPVCR